jgi:hypothetical protein
MRNKFAALLVFFSYIQCFASGANEQSEKKPSRENKRFGVYSGGLSDPVGMLPISVAYNINSFLRINGGIALSFWGLSADVTGGGGFKVFYPEWKFSPAAGFNAGYYQHNSSGSDTTNSNKRSAAYGYVPIGFDYQGVNGFNLGLGFNIKVFKTAKITGLPKGWPGLPYVSLGWFF